MTAERLGQHFLADTGWRERLARAIGAGSGEGTARKVVWVEIGAGHGEMTALLARQAARVIAIELDPKLAAHLEALARQLGNVEVVRGDVLALDLGRLVGSQRCRVYGNLPYYISSPILRRLFEFAERCEAIHVVVQFEVAARLVARPGKRDYGFLSVLAQFYTRPSIVLRVPPGAFRPRPKVASALVSLRPPGEGEGLRVGEPSEFFEFVKVCFAQKRKTLLNNLRAHLGAAAAERALEACASRPDARAEQLSLAQFAALFAATRSTA